MSKAVRYCALILCVLTCGLLAACSSSDDDGDGTAGANGNGDLPDPCDLLDMPELSAIVGRTVVASDSFDDGLGDPSCIWRDDEDFQVVQLVLYARSDNYEFGKTLPDAKPVSGVGDDAYLSSDMTIFVDTSARTFSAQSVFPVADGQISPEIQSAATGIEGDELGSFEASFRIAKLVVGRL